MNNLAGLFYQDLLDPHRTRGGGLIQISLAVGKKIELNFIRVRNTEYESLVGRRETKWIARENFFQAYKLYYF